MATLQAGATTTLDANGAATVVLGPGRPSERWAVTRYSTLGTSATEPTLNVYRSGGLIDTTPHGNSDVSEVASDLSLWAGEVLTFTYTGGTPGAHMTVYVEGDQVFGA